LSGEISKGTLGHYDRNAASFWEGTKDHDVSQNMDALLRHIAGDPPLRILDLGCGPGRDLMAWTARGHEAVGLDGSAQFCEMARARSGCAVLQQDFLQLDLPAGAFDGVFANAALFHVPAASLPTTLSALHGCLKPRGVLMSSNPRGQDQEGWNGERFGRYHSLEGWRAFMTDADFEECEHYYRPTGLPRADQPWLVTVWRRL
jgi:SAM-dependent methyltransferase